MDWIVVLLQQRTDKKLNAKNTKKHRVYILCSLNKTCNTYIVMHWSM